MSINMIVYILVRHKQQICYKVWSLPIKTTDISLSDFIIGLTDFYEIIYDKNIL